MRDSGEAFNMVYKGMVSAGIDVPAIMRRFIESGYKPTVDGHFPHEMQAQFWRIMEDVTGDPEVGLHLCPHLPVYRGRVFEYIFLSSANYEKGLRASFQYRQLISDAFSIRLETSPEQAKILLNGGGCGHPLRRHTEVTMVYAFLRGMAVLTQDNFVPRHVRLAINPVADAAEYTQIFGCPVTFATTENEIWLDPELLRHRSPHSDNELLQLHKKYGDNQLAKQARHALYDDVHQYLIQQVERIECCGSLHNLTLPEVARRFGVSARHLRFILSEVGTNFSRVLLDARLRHASLRLRETQDTVVEVAIQAGYSEPSAFRRAFKQWCGQTPRQYRQSILARSNRGMNFHNPRQGQCNA